MLEVVTTGLLLLPTLWELHLQATGVKNSNSITYKVEYYSADELRSEWLLGATDVPVEMFTLQYLKPNTEYIFFVRAVSPEGIVSGPSPLSDSATTHISTNNNRNNDDLEMARSQLSEGIVVLLKNAYPTSSTSIKIEWQMLLKSTLKESSYMLTSLIMEEKRNNNESNKIWWYGMLLPLT
ncbi:Roundabout 2 [Orchesella cincta]|uniref:Roundabout 2 n=1 Tax=Orchesella cincta TaxID=48709 RepID=A0A1D2N2H3_ORCCI|nr:Roundabout 2 [Orchesella cincta]